MYYLKIKYKNECKEEIRLDKKEFDRIQTLADAEDKPEKVRNINEEIINIDYDDIDELILSIDSKDFSHALISKVARE